MFGCNKDIVGGSRQRESQMIMVGMPFEIKGETKCCLKRLW